MTQITICTECKHSQKPATPSQSWTCDAPREGPYSFITGESLEPLGATGCSRNKGKCRDYRNKETGKPLKELFDIWCLIPVVPLILIIAALVWMCIT